MEPDERMSVDTRLISGLLGTLLIREVDLNSRAVGRGLAGQMVRVSDAIGNIPKGWEKMFGIWILNYAPYIKVVDR